jgi:hypothetical protein
VSVARRRPFGRWVVLAGVVLVAGGALARLYLHSGPRRRASPRGAARAVAAGVRIKVEVLNATDATGLARAATCVMRNAGFDVVFFGATAERTDTTRILDRSGHADWAALAARAMAPATVEEKPDSSRFLDLTVLVGRSWTAPGQPLCP